MNDMPHIDSKGRVYKYGEFFPSELSPFAYNETIAQEYYPKKVDEIIRQGFIYRKPLDCDYIVTLESKNLPDHIKDANENILNEIISCSNKGGELTQCTFAYRIVKEELNFLKRHNKDVIMNLRPLILLIDQKLFIVKSVIKRKFINHNDFQRSSESVTFLNIKRSRVVLICTVDKVSKDGPCWM